jgi:hypothetical protein
VPEASSSADFGAALSLLIHLQMNPVIGALVRHNVPDHLGDAELPASQLAHSAQVDTLSLTRALRALAGLGAFHEVSPGVFSNNGVSNLFRNRPGGLRNCALFYTSDHYVRSVAALGHSIVTGESASTHVFGNSVWEYFGQHPEQAETFNRMLAEVRGDEHRQIAEAYDWTGINTVVDVGGGVGSLLASILEKQVSARGILIEQPFVLAGAGQFLAERGFRQRTDLVGGSFFDPISTTAQVWTLCQVLHDWPDKECCAILNRCRAAMRPTDRLLVIEMLTVPCQPNARVGLIDMTMLMYFGEGRQRTVDEYTTLFNAAGFKLSRVLATAGTFSIVEATPV